MKAFLLRLALLCVVWLLALGRISAGDIVVGLLISAGLLLLLDSGAVQPGGPPLGRRVLAFGPFLMAVFRDVLAGTWAVTLVVLGRRPAAPGYIEIPIGARTPTGVAVTALLVTLAPGSVFVDVDWDRQVMLFHLLDASDPDATRATIARFYERYQRAVFP
jgi:multisubunit Na+/H+ antiporter MnhE subunit